MKRTPITVNETDYPLFARPFLRKATVYDSSCSPQAQVLFLDCGKGYYLKRSPLGTLKREAEMTRYFHEKGLATKVLLYYHDDFDWLLTERAAGEDCTHPDYLADPKRLCELLAERLRFLHAQDCSGCPVPHHTQLYLASVAEGYRIGRYDPHLFGAPAFASPEDAWQQIQKDAHLLEENTLLHGDYCLPNVLLDHWRFSAFLDLDHAGVGDRHIDLFWGAWTLQFNLKTDRYRDYFFDAYGRDRIDQDRLRLVGACELFG